MNITAMALFSLIMSITPGPVNIVTLSSGVNYGFRRTLPYVSGATIGFSLLLISLGLGLSTILMTFPKLLNYSSYIGTAYLVYMGYKIIRSASTVNAQRQSNVPKFIDGALLQLSNPKAWVACLSGISTFSSATSIQPLLSFVMIYFLICYASIGLWAFAGMQLQSILSKKSHMKLFNWTMGLLLIITSLVMSISN